MSTEDFKLSADSRSVVGKGASRRLRRESGLVPGIVYGDEKDPKNITVSHKELTRHLEHESFYSHIISLSVDGKAEDVILKDLQRHPAKPKILHVDFMRVSKSKKITISVPLHFLNETTCKGVKVEGGVISHNMIQLEVSCLAADLPEFIEVDLADVGLGQTLHISDLKLPKGVESVQLALGEDHDQPVVSVNKPKGIVETDEDSAEDGEGEGA